jgi:hypothetical protein
MRRRDVPKILLASTAGAALPAGRADSQARGAPIVARTPAETRAGVTPADPTFPQGDARRYGAVGDGVADDTASIQKAVNFCIAAGIALQADGTFLLTSPVNVDRHVDGGGFDNYFHIRSSTGGGFVVKSDIAMFTSAIAYTNAPVSQLIYFDGLNFSGTTSGSAFVLSDGRFLRMRFHGCSFDRIRGANSTIDYTQSIQFTNCNMRHGAGAFWGGKPAGVSYDFKFTNNIVEAWSGDFLHLGVACGCSVADNLMEGISGTAVVAHGAQGLMVSGNYFEANGRDLDLSGGGCAGVAFMGNRTYPKDRKAYSVLWGPIQGGCISAGNWSGGYLHSLPANSRIQINDYAAGSVYSNPPAG